jgi:RNA recognition motif-containing protein
MDSNDTSRLHANGSQTSSESILKLIKMRMAQESVLPHQGIDGAACPTQHSGVLNPMYHMHTSLTQPSSALLPDSVTELGDFGRASAHGAGAAHAGAAAAGRAALTEVNHNNTKTLWMGDLAPFMDEAFLHAVFSPTKQLVSVKVIRNKLTGASEGYAFIEMNTHDAAESLLQAYNGKVIPGTNSMVFRLNWAAYGVGRSSQPTNEDFSLFVGDVAPDVSDLILQEYFRQFYPSVRSAKVITDASTGRSKGYGFVRFSSESERNAALSEMNGHFLSNRPIRVSLATAKKNATPTPHMLASQVHARIGGDQLAQPVHPSDLDPTNTTLFIGGLSSQVMEEQLRGVFSQFGEIIYVKIPHGKGCGFVQFVLRTSAERAILSMNGKVLGNSAMRISWGRSSSRSNSLSSPLPQLGDSSAVHISNGGVLPLDNMYGISSVSPQLHSSFSGATFPQQHTQQVHGEGIAKPTGVQEHNPSHFPEASLTTIASISSLYPGIVGGSSDSRSVSSYNTTGPPSSLSEHNCSSDSPEQHRELSRLETFIQLDNTPGNTTALF